MCKDKKKAKKPKVTYIDDGRSLADMSGVGGKPSLRGSSTGSFSDQAKTFFAAQKMMLKPMLVTMGIIALIFFILWLIFYMA